MISSACRILYSIIKITSTLAMVPREMPQNDQTFCQPGTGRKLAKEAQNIKKKTNVIFKCSTIKLVYMQFFSPIWQVDQYDPLLRGRRRFDPPQGGKTLFFFLIISYLNSAHSNCVHANF